MSIELQNNTIYTSEQIAEWMGISKQGFSKSRKKKLDELGIYCDFKEEGKRIHVLYVFDNEYNKKKYNNMKKTLTAMREVWGSGNGQWGLDRDTEVAKKIKMRKEYKDIDIKESTIRVYTGKNRRKFTNWQWKLAKFKVDEQTGIKIYYDFTPEEKKAKSAIWKDLFVGEDVDWAKEQRALIKEAYDNGEATKEEYADRCLFIDSKLDSIWQEYKRRVSDMCGCEIERCADVLEEVAYSKDEEE